jgi:hypothetical protein
MPTTPFLEGVICDEFLAWAGLLALGSTFNRSFPRCHQASQWISSCRHRIQRRDRDGFAPSSLLAPGDHKPIPEEPKRPDDKSDCSSVNYIHGKQL